MGIRIPGFDDERIAVGDVRLNVATAGSGPPIVLLHGFPQTHLAWRHVATDLAPDHQVVCPDLRGYGDSDKPADERDGRTYAKRTMAEDIVELMRSLGHSRFALAGHDRGGLVSGRTRARCSCRSIRRRSGPSGPPTCALPPWNAVISCRRKSPAQSSRHYGS
ncbi:alpha/beta fold hydrolase [Nocardia sp. NPDC050193]